MRGSSTRAGASASSIDDDVHDAVGEAGLAEDGRDLEADGRRRGRRLQDDGVPGGEGGDDAREGQEQGVVPGRDHEDDAVGGVGDAALLVGEEEDRALDGLVAEGLLRVAGGVLQALEGREDLDRVGLGGRLPLLLLDEPGQLVRPTRRASRARSRSSPLSRKESALQAGNAAWAAATADETCSASRRLTREKASPVAGLTTWRVPARPGTARPPIQEWRVARASETGGSTRVAIGIHSTPAKQSTMEGVNDDREALREANNRFYRALEVLDLEALDALWLHEGWVRCVHPGWDVLVGWEAVRESYEQIVAGTRWMRVTPTAVQAPRLRRRGPGGLHREHHFGKRGRRGPGRGPGHEPVQEGRRRVAPVSPPRVAGARLRDATVQRDRPVAQAWRGKRTPGASLPSGSRASLVRRISSIPPSP